MIAVDTHILVYAHRADAAFYESAKSTLRGLLEGSCLWTIPWHCLHEFYAIVTHPRIYKPPTPASQALVQMEAMLACPTLRIVAETPDYWSYLKQLLETAKVVGPSVHDARIAAVCLANGVDILWSADRDFTRFKQLKVFNPLI